MGARIVLEYLWHCLSFATVYFLNKGERRYFLTAIPCSLLATFSFGHGILIYPVGFALLILKRSGRNLLWVWGGIMAATMVFYFWDYRFTRAGVPISLLFTNPILFVAWVFSFLGGTLKYFSSYVAPLAGPDFRFRV